MGINSIVSVALAIVFVAGLGVAVSHTNTAKIISAITGGFSSALRSALGH